MTAAHELDLLELRRRKRLNLINNAAAESTAAPAFRELPKPVTPDPGSSNRPFAPQTAELHSSYHAGLPGQSPSTSLPTLPSISTMLASLQDPALQRPANASHPQHQSRSFPAGDSLLHHSLASTTVPHPAALPPHSFNMSSSRDLIQQQKQQQPYYPTTPNDLITSASSHQYYPSNGPNSNSGFAPQQDYYPQNELASPRESQWKNPVRNPYADRPQGQPQPQYQQPQSYSAQPTPLTDPYHPSERSQGSYQESKLPPPDDYSLPAAPPTVAPFATMTPSQLTQYQHIQQRSSFNTLPMNPAFTSKQRRPIRSMLIVFEIATTAASSSPTHQNPTSITTSTITPIVISTSPSALTNTFRPLEELAAPYIFMFGESNKGSENATHRCRSQIDRLNKFYMSLASASRCSNARCQITTPHLFCKVHRPGGRAITFWAPRADFRAALAPQGGSPGVVDEDDDEEVEERWNDTQAAPSVPVVRESNEEGEKRKRRRSPEPDSRVVSSSPPQPQPPHGSYSVDAPMIQDVELVMAEATVRARREALERAERAVAMEREKVEREEGALMRRRVMGEVL
ncbi:hypothetical protein BJ742DRAFT_741988 [Cladochytrium replicatum]|nr:hypothetical protein BJ742DRAFT_741988 [Cladochytrium replicatum]